MEKHQLQLTNTFFVCTFLLDFQMREVLSLHLGQAGIALGTTCWDVLNQENASYEDFSCRARMWSELPDYQYTPRALFVDSDPASIHSLQRTPIGTTLSPTQMISGSRDMGGVYQGSNIAQLAEKTIEEIRHLAENCSQFEGFIVFHSLSGGTGTALSNYLISQFQEYSPKLTTHTLNILPSASDHSTIVAPYNACLSTHSVLENADISFMVDNAAIGKIADSALGVGEGNYDCFNQIVAQAYSALTSDLRYESNTNAILSEFVTNLVPFPNFRGCTLSFAPYFSPLKPYSPLQSIRDINEVLFTPFSSLATCNRLSHAYLKCLFQYRGAVIPKDISSSLASLKTRRVIHFADWSNSGFQCRINYQHIEAVPNGYVEVAERAALMVSNSTAVKEAYKEIVGKAEKMMRKRTFWHWYLRAGVEIEEVNEAIDYLHRLILDYYEAEQPSPS